MTPVVELARVRRALAALDALVARFPGLRGQAARTRLETVLDGSMEANDGGRHGDEKEDR